MTSRLRNRPERGKAVFINCPFDDKYKPLFRAMCFAVQACGFVPRCALDFGDSGASRFQQILNLIVECGFSIHDISRVALDSESQLPRFNMPLELGADLGLKILGARAQRDRRLLIFDTEKHRYDLTASDLSGQDIEAHADNAEVVIAKVRDWLNQHRDGQAPLPGASALQADYRTFVQIAPEMAEAAKLDAYDDLPHADFQWLVAEALGEIESARQEDDAT